MKKNAKQTSQAGDQIDPRTGRRIVSHHAEWELEKQTEGLTPSVVKASEELEHEMEREAKNKK